MYLSELPTQGRNFRPVQTQTAERGLSETTQDLREEGSELPTLDFYLAEDPLSEGARHFRRGSELPTPTEKTGTSDQVGAW